MTTVNYTFTGDGLQYILDNGLSTDLVVHTAEAFTAAPSYTTTLGDITEVTDANYVTATVAPADWSYTQSSPNAQGTATPSVSWTADASVTIDGFYITDSAGTTLVAAGQLSSTMNLVAGIDVTYDTVTLTIS